MIFNCCLISESLRGNFELMFVLLPVFQIYYPKNKVSSKCQVAAHFASCITTLLLSRYYLCLKVTAVAVVISDLCLLNSSYTPTI